MKKLLSLITLISISYTGFTQYQAMMEQSTQASLGTLQGTARYVGSGGVISSVGGDLSILSTNPAGLGMFSRSEFSFTPTLSMYNVHNNYQYSEGGINQGAIWNNTRTKFLFNSIGVVIANRKSDKKTLRASNITIGLNRTADFNRSIDLGTNSNSVYSYSNFLSDQATQLIPYYNSPGNLPVAGDYAPLDNIWNRTLIARNAELIEYDAGNNEFVDPTPYFANDLNVSQFGQQKIIGGINELSFAWAGNFSDRYYLGVSLGIPIMNYKKQLVFTENNNGGVLTHSLYGDLLGMDISESDEYSGVGVNLKLGGLVKITEDLKASVFIHTPTYYSITNNYIVSLTADYQNSTNTNTQATEEYNYNLITPFKFGGGLSHMLGKFGFIGLEYEFNNLGNLMVDMESDPNGNSIVNSTLSAVNQDYHIFKIGTELLIPDFEAGKRSPFRIRLGYNYRTSPKQSTGVEHGGDHVAQTYTAGLGYRAKRFSVDLAYMKTQYRDYDLFYDYAGSQGNFQFGSATWNSLNQFMATLNFRFK